MYLRDGKSDKGIKIRIRIRAAAAAVFLTAAAAAAPDVTAVPVYAAALRSSQSNGSSTAGSFPENGSDRENQTESRVYYYEKKPVLRDLLNRFPFSISVTYADGSTGRERVAWKCTENYDSSDLHMQIFLPELQNPDVKLQSGEKLPFITVYIADPESPAAASDDGLEVDGRYEAATNEENIFIFLRKEMGLNAAQAVGILTNIYAESSCNPQASGDNGTSYGICQWHNGVASRFSNLVSWCSSNGYDYTTLDGQLHYLQYEAESSYPDTMRAIRACGDDADGADRAAYLWCRNYEVPSNTEVTSHYRGEVARTQFYPRYQGYDINADSNADHGSSGDSGSTDNNDPGGSTDNRPDDVNVDPTTLNNQWYRQGGMEYWYENGVRQGTADDPKGVWADGTNRGREIYDPSSNSWYWLDAVSGGARAAGKEVYVPYIYQEEQSWSDADIWSNANASDDGLAYFVGNSIRNRTGKWVRYDGNGHMLTGWVVIVGDLARLYPNQAGNTYYYDTKTGLMAKGWVTIGGQNYYFDENSGVLIQQ